MGGTLAPSEKSVLFARPTDPDDDRAESPIPGLALAPTAAAVVLVAVALLASGCDWLQAGYGGERRFFNPFEPALTASNVGSLHQTFTVAEPVGAVGDPIVADGKLALASRDLAARTTQVSTWDATTGAARWTVTLPGSSVDVTNVVAASGRLFVVVGGADQSETVLALSIDDGSTVW